MPSRDTGAFCLHLAPVLILPLVATACRTAPSVGGLKERRAEVVFRLNLKAPENSTDVRVWIPLPVSDENQTIEEVEVAGNYTDHGIYKEEKFGNSILYVEWKKPGEGRTLTYRFKVKRKEAVRRDFPRRELSFPPTEFAKYLVPTSLGPTTGKVQQRAEMIINGKKNKLEKARAIYDWIVDNMYRDPDVKGCGYGDVERLLGTLGGKCGDISSVYVALAKSVGIPAREIFGIRLPPGRQGDMTKAQHCWAEFYLPGYGWVLIDPADVRKIMLEKGLKPGEETQYREYYFGTVDANRIAYGMGRDLLLNPPQRDGKLNYFMYPYAEADGNALDDLFGFDLGYTISFREL